MAPMTATPFALFARQRGKWLRPTPVATKTVFSGGTMSNDGRLFGWILGHS
jgi:hypothetical protein